MWDISRSVELTPRSILYLNVTFKPIVNSDIMIGMLLRLKSRVTTVGLVLRVVYSEASHQVSVLSDWSAWGSCEPYICLRYTNKTTINLKQLFILK